MGTLCSDEIVASVVSRSDNQIMRRYGFECSLQNRHRQVWTIAVEGNGGSLMFSWEVRKHRSETRSQTFTFLRNYGRFFTSQLHQLVYVRARAHDGDFHISQRPGQCQCVVKKTAIEISDSFRRKFGRQASLDCT